MSVLVAHHLEDYWDSTLSKFNTSFEEEVEKVCDFVKHSGIEFDEIIVTSFENNEWDYGHHPLIELAQSMNISITHEVYAYGMVREPDDEDTPYQRETLNETWCFGERDYHSGDTGDIDVDEEQDVLDIEDWMKDLKGKDVFLVGAFEGECLNDMETIFENQGISYHKINELCVGTGIEYEMQEEEIVNEIFSEINQEIQDLEDKMLSKLDKYDYEDIDELIDNKPHIVKKMIKDVEEIASTIDDKLEEKNIDKFTIDIDSHIDGIQLEEITDALTESFNEESISIKKDIKTSQRLQEKMMDMTYPRPSLTP